MLVVVSAGSVSGTDGEEEEKWGEEMGRGRGGEMSLTSRTGAEPRFDGIASTLSESTREKGVRLVKYGHGYRAKN